MHNYLSIVRLQLRNLLRRNREDGKSKTWIATVVGLSVLYVIIAAAFVSMIILFGLAFAQYNLQSEFITMILLCGLMVVLIFGIVTVLTCLYFSKDTEFFLALPVRPSTVFAAKLTVVYLTELCVTALIMLPCMIAAGVIMHLSAVFYVLLPIAIIITPMIPLFFAAIISIPIMYIASFLKNKGTLGSVVILILFGTFFGLYYFGIMRMQNVNPEEVDLSAVQHIFQNISNTVYPLYALARAMTLQTTFGLGVGASFVVNFLICILSVAAIGTIAFLISAAVYRRGAAVQLESAKQSTTTVREYRSSNAQKALMKKEWREIIRTPSYAMNCLIGVVTCPIIVAFTGFSTNMTKIAAQAAEAGTPIDASTLGFLTVLMRFVMLFIILFMSATNSAPATAVSREGGQFDFCKLMPVSHKEQLRAKSYIYFAISAVASLLSVATMAIMSFDLSFFLCSVALVLLFQYANVHYGMILDVIHPKLKWTTPNEVLKQNRNVVIYVFSSMLIGAFIVGAGAGTYALVYFAAGNLIATVCSWVAMFVLAIAAMIICHVVLYSICEKRLNAVEG